MRALGDDPLPWLLESGLPWVKLGVLREVLDRPEDDPEVVAARAALAEHPLVAECVAAASSWPEPALRRHDDAKHPLHRLKMLVDLGVGPSQPGLEPILTRILAAPTHDGQFRSLVMDPELFEPAALAFPCDAPVLLGVALGLSAPGSERDARIGEALEALDARREADGGWFCHADWHGLESEWRRRPVSCPIATLYSLWALARLPAGDPRRVSRGSEVLLEHFSAYDRREGRPVCHFQAGKRFRRRKFPLVWYDVLHVLDVLVRFDDLLIDPRLRVLADAAIGDAPDTGARFKAGSVWTAYKAYDFGQKREVSPTVTLVLARALRRLHG